MLLWQQKNILFSHFYRIYQIQILIQIFSDYILCNQEWLLHYNKLSDYSYHHKQTGGGIQIKKHRFLFMSETSPIIYFLEQNCENFLLFSLAKIFLHFIEFF